MLFHTLKRGSSQEVVWTETDLNECEILFIYLKIFMHGALHLHDFQRAMWNKINEVEVLQFTKF